uniref:Methyltransferase domain-containing protein n=1 Tax=Eutreptiella gymnastica TaxID=73025 RepID=A0A7S4CZ65_9EUGL
MRAHLHRVLLLCILLTHVSFGCDPVTQWPSFDVQKFLHSVRTNRYYLPSRRDNLDGPLVSVLLPFRAYGYGMNRHMPRWCRIQRRILRDYNWERSRALTILDYGSNTGFFSLALSYLFPRATVVSLDIHTTDLKPEGFTTNISGTLGTALLHDALRAAVNITNNVMCSTSFATSTFSALREKKLTVDVQLLLSVIHWLGIKDAEAFDRVFCDLLHNAHHTYIEFPISRKRGIGLGLGSEYVKKWMARDETPPKLMEVAAKKCGIRIKIVDLNMPFWKRVFYRVTNLDYHKMRGEHSCSRMYDEVFQCKASPSSNFTTCDNLALHTASDPDSAPRRNGYALWSEFTNGRYYTPHPPLDYSYATRKLGYSTFALPPESVDGVWHVPPAVLIKCDANQSSAPAPAPSAAAADD